MAEFEKVEFEFPDEVEAKGKPEEKEVSAEPELEIEVEDDTPPEDRNRRPAMDPEAVKKLEVEVDELDKYSAEAKDKVIKMKKVWNDERRRADSAEREQRETLRAAEKLMAENKRMKEMIANGEKEYVAAMKGSADMQLEMAKRSYKEAYDSGDSDRVLDAQQAITEATLRLDKVKNFKLPPLQEDKFEVQREEQYQPPPKPDDKVMAWQEENLWFGQDEEMTASALGLHEKLKRQGVVVGSDEYYATLDKTMRKRFPEEFDEPEEVAVKAKEDAPKAKPSTVVAPATRSTASKKVKLTTTQVALAKKLGLTPEQYVRELLKMEA
ncbi:MAG: hypothetical protein WCK49_10485 [Myxococcaceae bacterium]